MAAIIFSALAMTAIVGIRYLLTSGGFALATRLKHPGLYRGLEPQMRREIGWSLASAAIYGIPAGVVADGPRPTIHDYPQPDAIGAAHHLRQRQRQRRKGLQRRQSSNQTGRCTYPKPSHTHTSTRAHWVG